jgi:hypothetical protein
MVVAATSSWRSGDYSDVLINYFGENSVKKEDGVVEMKTNRADGTKVVKMGPAQKSVNGGPSQVSSKKGKWFWVCKGQSLHPSTRV